ncbi:MAG TPA: periplasmic heavy metal sensor [Pyrinomonadaceae bacterium]|nr:periplasmic heavy metal sensor [Pyrinomonadaceae bacterium]
MKYTRLFLFLLAMLFSGSLTAFGQDGPPPTEDGRPPMDRPEGRRPNLLAELGLSPDQVREIRRMNQGHRPQMMRAQHRVGEATKALDMAIYADTYSEPEYQACLKEFQLAQAEVARLRFESELSVRKVLTPEQLVKFRGIREQFAQQRRENMKNRRERRDGRGFAPRRDGPPNKPIN